MANSIRDWLRRYWLWLLLVGGFVTMAVLRLWPRTNQKAEVAKIKVQIHRDQWRHERDVLEDQMEARIKELIAIQDIKDPWERRRRLVEYSNRKEGRT